LELKATIHSVAPVEWTPALIKATLVLLLAHKMLLHLLSYSLDKFLLVDATALLLD
jgi:hypothetical protein